jgi:hypothetical protein
MLRRENRSDGPLPDMSIQTMRAVHQPETAENGGAGSKPVGHFDVAFR